jgi:hypothetical protein
MTSELPAPARAASGADLSDFGYDAQLRRSLSLGDLLVYGLVFISPIAPFAIFGIVFNASKGLVPLTYMIGLVAMLFTALSYREMSTAFPIAGCPSTPMPDGDCIQRQAFPRGGPSCSTICSSPLSPTSSARSRCAPWFPPSRNRPG